MWINFMCKEREFREELYNINHLARCVFYTDLINLTKKSVDNVWFSYIKK